jgi:hypothetical protein
MTKWFHAIATPVILLGLLSGCTAGADTNPSPTQTPIATPQPTLTWSIAPLTGRKFLADSNLQLTGPVVMGKIDNSFGARPQAGLSQADVVYEELVEGGITRYLAIFHSRIPQRFGPIRSVRPMDPDIAAPYGGILAYSGGQKAFVLAARATGLYNASETSEHTIGTMKRVKDRFAPHNLFVIAQKLQGRHMKLKPPTSSLTFATKSEEASALAGRPVVRASAIFPQTKATWVYDSAYNVFLREQDGEKTIDADFNNQVSSTNVVFLNVKIDRSFKDPRYGSVPKTVFEGKGTGKLMTGGFIIDIKWSKKNQKSHAVFTTKSGAPITLAAGNTWFEMVPIGEGSVDIKYAKVAPSPTATATAAPSPSASATK